MGASQPGLDGRSDVPRGLMAEILSLIGSSGRYLQAILALAGEESREAIALYTRLLVMLAAALFFAALGYILLVIAVVFLAAHFLGLWCSRPICRMIISSTCGNTAASSPGFLPDCGLMRPSTPFFSPPSVNLPTSAQPL